MRANKGGDEFVRRLRVKWRRMENWRTDSKAALLALADASGSTMNGTKEVS